MGTKRIFLFWVSLFFREGLVVTEVVDEGEEFVEQTEVKSDSTKDIEEQFSNAEVVTDDSERVILQVQSSELTSVGDAAN